MAKQKDAELLNLDAANQAALATVGLDTGLTVEGMSGGGVQVSRLAMFNDTAEEKMAYGSRTWGDYIDTLSGESLGASVQIMPISAWVSWAKWEKGSPAPIYSTKIRGEVPSEDLEWNGDEPPAANEIINVVVLVVGQPWPYLFQFKRTGLKAFNKTIGPMEGRRGALRKGPGLYELGSENDKSVDNKPYKRVTARYVGDPSPEMVALAVKVKGAIESVKAKAEALADDHEPAQRADKDDNIPI